MKSQKKNRVKKYNNLILGFAGPYGSGSSSLSEELERSINDWPGCIAKNIHVANLIESIYPFVFNESLNLEGKSKADLRKIRQAAGTKLRKSDPEFIGKLICNEIVEKGLEVEEDSSEDIDTIVFLIDSIKNTNEVHFLRRLYSDEFYLIYVYSDKETRWRRMEDYKGWDKKDRVLFEQRDQVDQNEKISNPSVKDSGQQVGQLSSKADYYILNAINREKLKNDGERFINLLFGDSMNQPNIHERSMHLAFSASNRSFCLSRQVGAAIIDNEGNILSVGHNDVPKAFGGLYSVDCESDKRCYITGDRRCINDTNKEQRFNKLTDKIQKKLKLDGTQAVKIKELIEKSEFSEATEYCRAVHAEMEALLSLIRSGNKLTKDSSMYVTTEPCHNCIKHIIVAGIKNVFYIEPYPKSLGLEFHSDALESGPNNDINRTKVNLIPYSGIAPHRFHDFFLLIGDRKDDNGHYQIRSKEDQSENPIYARLLIKRSRKRKELDDPITIEESRNYNKISIIYKKKAKQIKLK
jgi:deoxycytidylate deaminase